MEKDGRIWYHEQIGRKLPLPAKKGTESAEITTSTIVAKLKETATGYIVHIL